MLLERLERLEDEYRALQASLSSKIPHEWWKITFKAPVSAGDDAAYYASLRVRWINQLFSQRARFEPTFAFWHWFIEGMMEDTDDGASDAFHIHAYIRFKNYTTLEDIRSIFGTVLHSAQPLTGGMAELKMVLEDRTYNNGYDYFNGSTADYGMDMWRRGGESFDSPAPTEWTDGDFLDSPEYRPPSAPDRQAFLDYLRLTIQQKRWMALFQEDL